MAVCYLINFSGSISNAARNPNIRITQVYYYGGNIDASYTHDFVELYNDSDEAADLSEYTLSTAPNGWSKNLTGVIPPRRFFLALYQGTTDFLTGEPAGGAALPTPDFWDGDQTQRLDETMRVILYYGSPSNLDRIDDMNSRSNAGATRAPLAPDAQTSIHRKKSGGAWVDTDNSANDFELKTPPIPRNTAYMEKTTPLLAWGALSNITHPAPLSSTQLGATSSAEGTFVYSLGGGAVTNGQILSAGTHQLVATFTPADSNAFNTPEPTTNSLTVIKGNQTITFGSLAEKVVGDAAFNLAATAGSGLAVGYTSSDTGVATISGITVTVVGKGTTTITASQAGNSNWNAAASVPQALAVKSRFAAWSGTETMTTQSVGLYAIGGASNSSATPSRPTSGVSGGNLTLTAIVRTNDPKLAVVGEASTNLTTWVTDAVTSSNIADTNGVPSNHARKTFSVPQSTDGKKFLRLKATLNP